MMHTQTTSKIRLVLFLAALSALMLGLPSTFNRGASAQQDRALEPGNTSPDEPPQTSPTLDDRFAEVARLAPAFGGFFIENERLNVYLTDTTQLPGAMQAIVAVFGKDSLPLDNPVAVPGRYNFTQLKGWHDLHRLTTLAMPGAQSVDIDERHNRLQINVLNFNARYDVMYALERLGIPAETFQVTVVEPTMLMQGSPVQNLQGPFRPILGGIQIGHTTGLCTLGFLAVRKNQAGFVTCSHCTAIQGGVESTVIYQATIDNDSPNRVGVEVADPMYFTGGGCPAGRKCRYSDSAFIKRDGTDDQVTPLTPGDFGFLLIPDLYAIPVGPMTKRQITSVASHSVSGETVEKVGRTTGHSQGQVNATCVDLNPNNNVNGVSVDSGITLLCQDQFLGLADGGDSGGPVFKLLPAPDGKTVAKLYGIAWGSTAGQLVSFSPIRQVVSPGELGALKTFKSQGPNSRPEVKILQPLNGATVQFGGANGVVFKASAVDYEDQSLTLTWTSIEEGLLGTGETVPHIFTTPGVVRHIKVTAEDSHGNLTSYSITVNVEENVPPVVTIEQPKPNQVVVRGLPYDFKGNSFDPNEPNNSLPCSNLAWSYKPTAGISVTTYVGNKCFISSVKFMTLGDHTITLAGTDSSGAQGTDHVTVQVVEPGSPDAIFLEPKQSFFLGDETLTLKGRGFDPESSNPMTFTWEVMIGGVRQTIAFGTAQNNQPFTAPFSPAQFFGPYVCGTKQVTVILTVTAASGKKVYATRDYSILFGPC